MLGGKKSYSQCIKITIFLKIKILKINLVREEDSVLLSEVTNKTISVTNLLPYKYTSQFGYVYMHAHLCAVNTSVYRYVCVCAYSEATGWHWVSSSIIFHTMFRDSISHSAWGWPIYLNWLPHELPGFSCIHLLALRLQFHTQVFMLGQPLFTELQLQP